MRELRTNRFSCIAALMAKGNNANNRSVKGRLLKIQRILSRKVQNRKSSVLTISDNDLLENIAKIIYGK